MCLQHKSPNRSLLPKSVKLWYPCIYFPLGSQGKWGVVRDLGIAVRDGGDEGVREHSLRDEQPGGRHLLPHPITRAQPYRIFCLWRNVHEDGQR